MGPIKMSPTWLNESQCFHFRGPTTAVTVTCGWLATPAAAYARAARACERGNDQHHGGQKAHGAVGKAAAQEHLSKKSRRLPSWPMEGCNSRNETMGTKPSGVFSMESSFQFETMVETTTAVGIYGAKWILSIHNIIGVSPGVRVGGTLTIRNWLQKPKKSFLLHMSFLHLLWLVLQRGGPGTTSEIVKTFRNDKSPLPYCGWIKSRTSPCNTGLFNGFKMLRHGFHPSTIPYLPYLGVF